MSDASDESDDKGCKKKGRKRIKNCSKWKNVQRKQARLAGESYTSTSGKFVEPKKPGPPCLCKRSCTEKFSDEAKSDMISKLYGGQPKNEQDTFLIGLIDVKDCKRHRKRDNNSTSLKQHTFSYFAIQNKERIPVCKKAFMSLYALSQHRLQRLNQIRASGDSPRDMRGKHNTRPHVLPTDILVKIKEHIASFPTKQTHYSSKTVTYLDAKLTVKTMHHLFIEKYPELHQKVKYEFYLKYFNENFAFRFGRPQVDVCSTCEELSVKLRNPNLNDNAKRVAAAEMMVHKRRAKKFYTKLEQVQKLCETNPEVAGFTFDYMQNLPLPNIPVQEIFYYRQLWVYLFEIHNLKDQGGFFYMYHEGQAKKSPDEVCTFLYDYITNHVPAEVKELHLFSDGCPGQNRNNTMVRFLLGLQATKRFAKINHYFPIRGHSFLPCDRDFGTLKRVIKKCDRVYTPEEYAAIVTACRKGKPFVLKTITHADIINFSNWWTQHFKKTCKSEETKTPLTVSKYRQFIYDVAAPGYVTALEYIDGAFRETFKLLKPNTIPHLPVTQRYAEVVPINEHKILDLKKILKYVSGETLEFYYHVISWPITAVDVDE